LLVEAIFRESFIRELVVSKSFFNLMARFFVGSCNNDVDVLMHLLQFQDVSLVLGISSFPALFFAFVVILAHLESSTYTWTANDVTICDQENRLGLAFWLSEICFPLIEQLKSRFHRGSNIGFWHWRDLIDDILQVVNNRVKLLEIVIEGDRDLLSELVAEVDH